MSLETDSWLELYDAQTEAIGYPRTATVGSVTDKKAISTQMATDEVIVAGGVAEAGGFTLQMLLSDFSGTPPDKFEPVTCDGTALQVLSANVNNGILYITCGEPAAND